MLQIHATPDARASLTPEEMAAAIRRQTSVVVPEVTDRELELLEGAVPGDLRGSLVRNGPGRLERGGHAYGHPFDGDGMVTRFAFAGDGTVRYRNRFVRTAEYRAEADADRVLYRGFGTQKPGGLAHNLLRFRFKNAANTSVVPMGDRLLALWEGGPPHALDPETLETLGLDDLGGALRNPFSTIERWISPHLPFSAHPVVDPETGELFNFGVSYGAKHRLLVYRASPDGRLDPPHVVPLDELSFVHDFAVTRDWFVFFLPRVTFDVPRALLGLSTPVGALRIEDGAAMEVLLVPRSRLDGSDAPVRRIPTLPGFVFHIAHAFTDDAGRVVVDGMHMKRFPVLDDLADLMHGGQPGALPRAVRFTIDPEGRSSHTRVLAEGALAELPTVSDGRIDRPHQAFWATAASPDRRQPYLSAFGRFDPAAGRATLLETAPNLPGEPLAVARPDAEGDLDAWLLVPMYLPESHASKLWIADADTLEVVCRLALPHPLPPRFHGRWLPSRD